MVDVIGIGNAMVDALVRCDDDKLKAIGVEKGIMQLIDKARANDLYHLFPQKSQVLGGSAANTIAGLALLGLNAAYVGKVKDDRLGHIFVDDMKKINVSYDVPLAKNANAHETGVCLVIVTPDGERSMNTYLGVSEELGPNDIDEDLFSRAKWAYFEGYRFDGALSHQAFAKAIHAIKQNNGKIALTLSDPFCVERHRDAFLKIIKSHVDLLFCNESEIPVSYTHLTLPTTSRV